LLCLALQRFVVGQNTCRLLQFAFDLSIAASVSPPESVKMLFDRYHRTKAGKAREAGLGLGLCIGPRIVEAHGGRIDVSSEVGNGSRAG
jgi:signal transduction histidine kinase